MSTLDPPVSDTSHADCRDVGGCGWAGRHEDVLVVTAPARNHNAETGHGIEVIQTLKWWIPPRRLAIPEPGGLS